jgi:hypothetical protein
MSIKFVLLATMIIFMSYSHEINTKCKKFETFNLTFDFADRTLNPNSSGLQVIWNKKIVLTLIPPFTTDIQHKSIQI